MKENEPVTYQVRISNALLEYIKPESGTKYSKMAAFRNLLEQSVSTDKGHPASCAPLLNGQAAVTVSGLSKRWNWHRTTVSKFLFMLEQYGAIKARQRGGFIIITMTCMTTEDGDKNTCLFSEDEQRMNRWLCGYLAIEELVETLVHFISGTDLIFGFDTTGKRMVGQTQIGERLHRLIAHIILRHTDIIPADKEVNEALEKLFADECGKDLARFLQRLTMAGLQLIGNGMPQDMVSPYSGNECTDIILRHYLPLISGRTSLLRHNQPKENTAFRKNRTE